MITSRISRRISLLFSDLIARPPGVHHGCSGYGEVWVTDPELVSFVLSSPAIFNKAPVISGLRWCLGDGTAASNFGDFERVYSERSRKRLVLIPAFRNETWRRDIDTFSFAPGRPVMDLYAWLHDKFFALSWCYGFNRVLDESVLSANKSLRHTAVSVAWAFSQPVVQKALYADRSLRTGIEWWRFLPLSRISQLRARRRQVNFLVQRLVHGASYKAGELSWLDVLRTVMDESEIAERQLRFAAIGLLLASYENSAAVASWLLWLLALNPALQEEIVDELLLGSTIKLEMALNEALRLFPPIWSIARLVRQDVSLGDLKCRAGSFVFISPWVQGRHPAFWNDANAVSLDRWEKSPIKGACLPFGFGPHGCPGESLARLQVLGVVSRLLLSGVFSVDVKMPRLLFGVSLRPYRGVRLVVSPRRISE